MNAEIREQLEGYENEIRKIREKIRDIQTSREPEPIEDYRFESADGQVSLSELFGAKQTLFVIHNMGKSCSYCTLWADGFNGVVEHLENRAGFVVSSPDSVDVQTEFAASRGWRFRMVSTNKTTFAQDLGYRPDDMWLPGVSVFKKGREGVVRVSDTAFGPGDDFCGLWHLFDLIPEGAGDWQPKFAY